MGFKNKKSIFAVAASVAVAVCAFAFTACNGGAGSDEPAPHRDAGNAVTKRGVCVSRYNDGKANSAGKVNSLNASWYYTWGVKTNNEYIDAEFVPMVWGAADVTDENIGYIKTNYENGKFSHLLTFNEPDLTDQANISVDEALSHWDKLQSIGIPLSSPVVSWYTPEKANPWLDEFMQKANQKNYRVDFVTIHIYQSFYSSTAVNELKATLDALYNKFKKPIWLTEFGAIDIIARDSHANEVSPSCTAKNAKTYVEQVTNMLEKCGYVERYSWFLDNFVQTGNSRPWEAPYTTLFNDNDTISEVGSTYASVASNIPLILETSSLANAKLNAAYSATVSVCGGTGNYTFTANGLPAGLAMSVGGTISGKPTASGIYQVKVTVSDSAAANRKQTRTHAFTLNVST